MNRADFNKLWNISMNNNNIEEFRRNAFKGYSRQKLFASKYILTRV